MTRINLDDLVRHLGFVQTVREGELERSPVSGGIYGPGMVAFWSDTTMMPEVDGIPTVPPSRGQPMFSLRPDTHHCTGDTCPYIYRFGCPCGCSETPGPPDRRLEEWRRDNPEPGARPVW